MSQGSSGVVQGTKSEARETLLQWERFNQEGLSKTAAEMYVRMMNLGWEQEGVVRYMINNLKQGDTFRHSAGRE